MASSELQPVKPAMPASWQWLLRLTGIFALLLFLTPTFYVVKYYAVDRPAEAKIAHSPYADMGSPMLNADYLPRMSQEAQAGSVGAVRQMGATLNQPGIGWKRPLECLAAKATLAELAAKSRNPELQAAASEELRKMTH